MDNNGFDKRITQGEGQTPYDEITFTLQAGEYKAVDVAFSYFRLLSLVGSGLKVRFGQSGSFSSIVGAGIGIELPNAVSVVEFQNTSGAAVTATMAYSMGKITDDRLNVTGSLSISTTQSSPLFVTNTGNGFSDIVDVVIPATTTSIVRSSNANTRTVMVCNRSANSSVVNVGGSSVGASRGVEIPIGATANLDTTGSIYVHNPSGAPVTIGITVISN